MTAKILYFRSKYHDKHLASKMIDSAADELLDKAIQSAGEEDKTPQKAVEEALEDMDEVDKLILEPALRKMFEEEEL